MEDQNTQENKTLERFSPELIVQYKKDHGAIFKYVAKDGKQCILKSPTLQIIDACRSISGGSSIKFDDAC